VGRTETEMEIVIDSNKIISAVVSKGIVRRIVIFSGINFYAPKELVEEIKKHREEICKRIGLKTEFFNFILEELILPKLNIVEESKYANKISEAYTISKEFDEKDTPFIALALKLKVPIWTNDKSMIEYGIKSQAYLAVDTETLIKALKGELKLSDWTTIRKELKVKYGL
jgi:predicted nucleic acid-binding protein